MVGERKLGPLLLAVHCGLMIAFPRAHQQPKFAEASTDITRYVSIIGGALFLMFAPSPAEIKTEDHIKADKRE